MAWPGHLTLTYVETHNHWCSFASVVSNITPQLTFASLWSSVWFWPFFCRCVHVCVQVYAGGVLLKYKCVNLCVLLSFSLGLLCCWIRRPGWILLFSGWWGKPAFTWWEFNGTHLSHFHYTTRTELLTAYYWAFLRWQWCTVTQNANEPFSETPTLPLFKQRDQLIEVECIMGFIVQVIHAVW